MSDFAQCASNQTRPCHQRGTYLVGWEFGSRGDLPRSCSCSRTPLSTSTFEYKIGVRHILDGHACTLRDKQKVLRCDRQREHKTPSGRKRRQAVHTCWPCRITDFSLRSITPGNTLSAEGTLVSGLGKPTVPLVNTCPETQVSQLMCGAWMAS